MAEIKSAIELAMEKTKGLVIDKEERDAIAAKELQMRISAVVRRYMEEMIGGEDVKREIEGIKADKKLKYSVLLDALIQEFDVKESNERLFDLFALAGLGVQKTLRDEFELLRRGFRAEMGERELTIGERIRNNLAALGIAGNGVEPNLRAWNEWQEGIEEAGNVFRSHMKEWKEKVKASIGDL